MDTHPTRLAEEHRGIAVDYALQLHKSEPVDADKLLADAKKIVDFILGASK